MESKLFHADIVLYGDEIEDLISTNKFISLDELIIRVFDSNELENEFKQWWNKVADIDNYDCIFTQIDKVLISVDCLHQIEEDFWFRHLKWINFKEIDISKFGEQQI